MLRQCWLLKRIPRWDMIKMRTLFCRFLLVSFTNHVNYAGYIHRFEQSADVLVTFLPCKKWYKKIQKNVTIAALAYNPR